MAQVEVVETWQHMLSKMGLKNPSARAFVAGVAVTSVLYFAGYPKEAWDEEGNMRPFYPLSQGPDCVCRKHFLVIPTVVTGAVFLFT